MHALARTGWTENDLTSKLQLLVQDLPARNISASSSSEEDEDYDATLNFSHLKEEVQQALTAGGSVVTWPAKLLQVTLCSFAKS